MKGLVLVPYASMSQESGIIYLLSHYLKEMHPTLTQIVCNGVFASCDRDRVTEWTRSLNHCSRCLHEQQAMAKWAGLQYSELSQFLPSEDVVKTRRWIMNRTAEELWEEEWFGLSLRSAIQGSLSERIGSLKPDFRNKLHQSIVKRLALVAIRMANASRRLNNRLRPDVVFLANGEDVLTRSYRESAEATGVRCIRFRWNMGSRRVLIHSDRHEEYFPCEVLLDNLAQVRIDVASWPEELLLLLDKILDFLDVPHGQLRLPLAQ
ncbi:MAG: hypothetical protein KDD64_15100 [Bdellovibrionales bacterium]|nr:hypothetical protein [Bdellovibrionales bacterium]